MPLMYGNRYSDHTISQIVHQSMSYFMDEGLLEKGFYVNISRPYYIGNSDISILTHESNETYSFSYHSLVWQTGVSTSLGSISRLSGIYVNDNLIVNDSSNYSVDYHNGILIFTDTCYSGLLATYGSDMTITADYFAKQIYVPYANGGSIYAGIDYISNNFDENIDIESLPFRLPILVGGIRSRRTYPYELGGTKYNDISYSLLFLSTSEELRDQVADVISKQKDVKIPSKIWKPMYDSNFNILYDDFDAYLNDCDNCGYIWIKDIDEQIFRGSIFAVEYDITLELIGINA